MLVRGAVFYKDDSEREQALGYFGILIAESNSSREGCDYSGSIKGHLCCKLSNGDIWECMEANEFNCHGRRFNFCYYSSTIEPEERANIMKCMGYWGGNYIQKFDLNKTFLENKKMKFEINDD